MSVEQNDNSFVEMNNAGTSAEAPINTTNTDVPSSTVSGPSGIAANKTCLEINNNEVGNDNETNNNDKSSDASPEAGPSGAVVVRKRNWIKCDICKVFVSSQKLMEVHLAGKRHILIAKKIYEQPRNYKCNMCNIRANSEKQLADHFASNKHKTHIEMLKRMDDIKFYCVYGTIVTMLAWIIVSYMFYVVFTFVE